VATRTPGWSQARDEGEDPEAWGEPRATREPPTRKVVVVDLATRTIKAVLEPFESVAFNPLTDAVVEVAFNSVGVVDGWLQHQPYLFSRDEMWRVVDEVLSEEYWKLLWGV